MMKKFLSLILALATVMAMSVPAFAIEIDSNTEGKASGNVDVSVTLESSYTLTIPKEASFDLPEGKATIPVTVEGRIGADKTVRVTPDIEKPFVSCGNRNIWYEGGYDIDIAFAQADIINSKTEDYTLTLDEYELSIAPAGEYTSTFTFYAKIIDGD